MTPEHHLPIPETAPFAPLWIGGHPAMDLLNTVVRHQGELVDLLQNDEAVVTWLQHADLLREPVPSAGGTGGLLRSARRLRETLREVVEGRHAGRRPELDALNSFLAAGRQTLALSHDAAGALRLQRRPEGPLPDRLLGPLATAAAELLATAAPHHIRRCEGRDCVLWFLDDSRSQRRRWCSMEICGNRAKVAAFRARQPETA